MASPYPPQPAHPVSSSSSSNDPADLLLEHFPSSSKLTREDLEEMLRSPEYFDSFFGTQPQVEALYKEHQELLQANQEVTAKNMAMKEAHEELKAQTSQAFEDARRLQERWHAHTEPMQADAYKRFAPQVQLSRLRQALGDQDRLSESLISSLMEGTLEPDDFAKQFKEIRKLYYRRGAQTEKWLNGQVEWRS